MQGRLEARHEKSMRKFLAIWAGQFLSILGSGISAFGLSVWILTTTSSNTGFAMSFLVQILPGIIFAPLAGSLADRSNRKRILLLTDSLDALLKWVMMLLLYFGAMKLLYVYLILFLSSTLNTFQGPAFDASVPQIVPKEQLGRANGLRQLTRSVQSMVAPVAAGALYPVIGLIGLLAIDFVTFLFAITTVLVQRIPQPILRDAKKTKNKVWDDVKGAMAVIRSKSGFIELIAVFGLLNFIANLAIVLIGPIVISSYSESIYGLVNSISGVAMVIGGVIAGAFPVKKHRVRSIFRSLIFTGLGLCIMGASPLWYVLAAGFFVAMLPIPFTNGTFGTLIHMKFPGEMLGRVGALIEALLKMITPIAFLLAGFLSDKVFNPLLVEGGALADTFVGRWIGVGSQRGSGLILIISGILLAITCIAMLCNKRVMMLEEVNPDEVE